MSHAGIETVSALLAESGLSAATIAEQREALDAMAATSLPPDGVSVEPVALAGRSGEWLAPEAVTADGVVLYLHGGGYCIGSLGSHRGLGSRLAMATGCPVVTLDYRLAPEHPFPAAVDDATGAYRDLLAIGAAPEQIAIAGDSAGGGLTVATLLALRAAGAPLPAAAVCLSPWADLTQSSPAYPRIGGRDPMVSKSGLDLMAEAYLAGTDPRTRARLSALRRGSRGPPPDADRGGGERGADRRLRRDWPTGCGRPG